MTREENARLKFIDEQLDSLRCPSSNSDEHSTLVKFNECHIKINLKTFIKIFQRSTCSNGSLIDEETLKSLLDECSMSNRKVINMIQN